MTTSRVVLSRSLLLLTTLTVGAESSACSSAVGEPVASQGEAVSSVAEIDYARVGVDPVSGQITETVFFQAPYQAASVCHAYLSGTYSQQTACNDYPNGYVAMNCILQNDNVPSEVVKGFATNCTSGNVTGFGAPPYDLGNGTYGIYFVNTNDPSNRVSTQRTLYSDTLELLIGGSDYPPYRNTFLAGGYYGVPVGGTTQLEGTLTLTLEVTTNLAGEVKGCATAYSTAGLTAAEIAKNDAEQLALCAHPTATIEGRGGWSTEAAAPGLDVVSLVYDATPLVQPNQHIIFAFSLPDRVQEYIFAN